MLGARLGGNFAVLVAQLGGGGGLVLGGLVLTIDGSRLFHTAVEVVSVPIERLLHAHGGGGLTDGFVDGGGAQHLTVCGRVEGTTDEGAMDVCGFTDFGFGAGLGGGGLQLMGFGVGGGLQLGSFGFGGGLMELGGQLDGTAMVVGQTDFGLSEAADFLLK